MISRRRRKRWGSSPARGACARAVGGPSIAERASRACSTSILLVPWRLYPGLSAVKLVGTDLVQAVPLVLAAAIANIFLNDGLDLALTIPLVLGSVPGTILGSKVAPRVPQSYIRRAIVVVLTMSGVALLDKSGWSVMGAEETYPVAIALVGLAMIVLVPLIWGLLRKEQGLPMFGAPTVAELEDPSHATRVRPRRGRGKR